MPFTIKGKYHICRIRISNPISRCRINRYTIKSIQIIGKISIRPSTTAFQIRRSDLISPDTFH